MLWPTPRYIWWSFTYFFLLFSNLCHIYRCHFHCSSITTSSLKGALFEFFNALFKLICINSLITLEQNLSQPPLLRHNRTRKMAHFQPIFRIFICIFALVQIFSSYYANFILICIACNYATQKRITWYRWPRLKHVSECLVCFSLLTSSITYLLSSFFFYYC